MEDLNLRPTGFLQELHKPGSCIAGLEFYPLISKEKKHWVKNLFSALIVTISKCVTPFILLTKTEDSRLFKAPGCSEIKCTQLSGR